MTYIRKPALPGSVDLILKRLLASGEIVGSDRRRTFILFPIPHDDLDLLLAYGAETEDMEDGDPAEMNGDEFDFDDAEDEPRPTILHGVM